LCDALIDGLTYTDSDLACTVEGAADVGKSVLKVRRGVAIMGKVTAYSAYAQGAPHALTNGIIDATSSSSSSCYSELDHALKAETSGGREPTSGAETEAGAIGETPPSSLALEVPLTAISEVDVAVSVTVAPVSMASSQDDGMREPTPDQSEPPDVEVGSSPVIQEETEGNSSLKSGVEIPLIGRDVLARTTDVEGSIPGLWHVLYDDGSEATLAHLELRSALEAAIFFQPFSLTFFLLIFLG
jgi:hypothetical protein